MSSYSPAVGFFFSSSCDPLLPPIFEAAGRGDKPYWGKWEEAAPSIILWESLAEEDREVCLKEMRT
jgi:hypothetical protein